MRQRLTLCAILTVMSHAAWAQTGMTYRFQEDARAGRVWIVGENSRLEIEAGDGGVPAARIEISKDGGKQIFVLNPVDHTYYEDNAYLARFGAAALRVSAGPLTAGRPFRVDGVEKLKVDLKVSSGTDVVSGYTCQRAILTFSYTLKLGLVGFPDTMPGRVEGSEEFCLLDAPNPRPLPFRHRLELTSGLSQVDAAFAERLATLKGIPVSRRLTVSRRIEQGELVSVTSTLVLSDIREEAVAADLFEVPKDYRFWEPVVLAPVRKAP